MLSWENDHSLGGKPAPRVDHRISRIGIFMPPWKKIGSAPNTGVIWKITKV